MASASRLSSRVRCGAAALLIPLLLLICSCSEAAPLLGAALLGSLLGGFDTTTNSTSALEVLALSHLQHKIDALSQLAELFALAGNVTESFVVS